MSLFDYIFKNRPKTVGTYEGRYKLLEGYSPHFTKWGGELYESELVRAAINARATHISKLDVAFQGSARPALQRKLKAAPNTFQTWSQFLYRLSTILDVHNTAFICPVYDEYGEPSGIYCPLPNKCEVVQYNNVPYLRYTFQYGESAAVELEYCGILTKMQYKSDLFGESNHALFPTMELIHTQNQGIEEGVKASASYRFMAKLTNFAKASDLAAERKRFTEENLKQDDGNSGILLFPNTYSDIKQIEAKPFVVDAEQAKAIRDNVFSYFGVNEKILTNEFDDKVWSAFYEGAIEPFAVQFSEVMTKMLFTLREQAQGNNVTATSNRLQYMSNADKLNVSAQLLDRGIFSINDVRQIWNLPPVEGGDARIIRGEYYNADDKVTEGGTT
jgi:hypothetical protein